MNIILSNFTLRYTLNDYFCNNIPADLEYWDYNEVQSQIEQCYQEYELNKDIEALLEERSWKASFRCMAIQRIAREAKEKRISMTLIFKFLKEYDIQLNEQVWFWMEYYK